MKLVPVGIGWPSDVDRRNSRVWPVNFGVSVVLSRVSSVNIYLCVIFFVGLRDSVENTTQVLSLNERTRLNTKSRIPSSILLRHLQSWNCPCRRVVGPFSVWSCDPGSIPGKTFKFWHVGRVYRVPPVHPFPTQKQTSYNTTYVYFSIEVIMSLFRNISPSICTNGN